MNKILAALVLSACFAVEPPTSPRLGQDGVIHDWVIIGPFASAPLPQATPEGITRDGYGKDFLEGIGGESNANFAAGAKVSTPDGKIRSATAANATDGFVGIPAFDRAVGYAFAQFTVDQDTEVALHLGSDGSPQVWVDHQRVIAGWRDFHKQFPWEYGCRLNLSKGQHRILVKLDNKRGWWGFSLVLHAMESEAVAAERLYQRLMKNAKPGISPLGFTIRRVERIGEELQLDIEPRPLVFTAPIRYSLRTGSATFSGMTGTPLKIPVGSAPIMSIALSSDDSRRVEHLSVSTGDPGQWAAKLLAQIQSLQAPKNWTEEYRAHWDWARTRLSQRFTPTNEKDLADLNFIAQGLSAVAAGGNPMAEKLGVAWPCLWNNDGKQKVPYSIEFVSRYGTGPGLPLLIDLHGGGYLESTMGADFVAKKRSVVPIGTKDAEQSHGLIRIDPSTNEGWKPALLDAFLNHFLARGRIDPDRVYLMGHSMGGIGTWNWAATNPERFAAIAPLHGFGDCVQVQRLVGLPIWAFAGAEDSTIPPLTVQLTVAAIPEVGGTPRFSLLPGGHTVTAFDLDALYDWFLTQRRDANKKWPETACMASDTTPRSSSGFVRRERRVPLEAPLESIGRGALSKALLLLGKDLKSLPPGSRVDLEMVPNSVPPRVAAAILSMPEGSEKIADAEIVAAKNEQLWTMVIPFDRLKEEVLASRSVFPKTCKSERLTLLHGPRLWSIDTLILEHRMQFEESAKP